jgi:hypothetical protein
MEIQFLPKIDQHAKQHDIMWLKRKKGMRSLAKQKYRYRGLNPENDYHTKLFESITSASEGDDMSAQDKDIAIATNEYRLDKEHDEKTRNLLIG